MQVSAPRAEWFGPGRRAREKSSSMKTKRALPLHCVSTIWSISCAGLDRLCNDPALSPSRLADVEGCEHRLPRTEHVGQGIVVIHISGLLLARRSVWGVAAGALSLADIASEIEAAAGDRDVRALVLSISSSAGGHVEGLARVEHALSQLRAAGTLSVSHVHQKAHGSALQLAALADCVTAESRASMGRIAAQVVVAPWPSVEPDEDAIQIALSWNDQCDYLLGKDQARLVRDATLCWCEALAERRGVPLGRLSSIVDGAVSGEGAHALGLIDAVTSLDGAIERVRIGLEMSDATPPAPEKNA